MAVAFGFVSVMVSVEVPPRPIGLGANALAIVGRASTVSVAEPPTMVPALVVVTLPIELL
jgi:hypothetical protein